MVPTEMPLPGARFARPSLQISTQLPGRATAGQAFTLSLRIANLTPQLQQLSVAVGDASGFVIAGRARVTLTLKPKSYLRIANLTPQLQQLSVAVGDASGFVIAGRAQITLTLNPKLYPCIANLTPQLQQLSVAVGNAFGFVIAGRPYYPHPKL